MQFYNKWQLKLLIFSLIYFLYLFLFFFILTIFAPISFLFHLPIDPLLLYLPIRLPFLFFFPIFLCTFIFLFIGSSISPFILFLILAILFFLFFLFFFGRWIFAEEFVHVEFVMNNFIIYVWFYYILSIIFYYSGLFWIKSYNLVYI